jgi:NTP pyrophosphatase (non-canonical NTP hydrolase)
MFSPSFKRNLPLTGHHHFDSLDAIVAKLIRRHPHIFGDVQADTSEDVKRNWDAIKARKRSGKALLDSVSRAMPALVEAQDITAKVAKVGFDWPSIREVFDKLHEEVAELEQAIASGDRLRNRMSSRHTVVVNLARKLSLDAEISLVTRIVSFAGGSATLARWPRRASAGSRIARGNGNNGRKQRQHCDHHPALESPEDFRSCVRLRRNLSLDEDALPVRLFIVCRRIGGQIFSAFDGEEIIGFCGAAGSEGGRRDYRTATCSACATSIAITGSAGASSRQRDDAMARGIGLIEWTSIPSS